MPLLLVVYIIYINDTVKQITDNEIYSLIKYIKSVLWRVAKRLSYTEDARCQKVKIKKTGHPAYKDTTIQKQVDEHLGNLRNKKGTRDLVHGMLGACIGQVPLQQQPENEKHIN